jgi:hypothetical protein
MGTFDGELGAGFSAVYIEVTLFATPPTLGKEVCVELVCVFNALLKLVICIVSKGILILHQGFRPDKTPIITGAWPEATSIKNPTTQSPNLGAENDLELLIGNIGTAQGKSAVGNSDVLSVCQPKILNLHLPNPNGSARSSTTPTNQTNPSLPIKFSIILSPLVIAQ